MERHGALGDGGKWVCGLSRVAKKPDCVVYSFGKVFFFFFFFSFFFIVVVGLLKKRTIRHQLRVIVRSGDLIQYREL